MTNPLKQVQDRGKADRGALAAITGKTRDGRACQGGSSPAPTGISGLGCQVNSTLVTTKMSQERSNYCSTTQTPPGPTSCWDRGWDEEAHAV